MKTPSFILRGFTTCKDKWEAKSMQPTSNEAAPRRHIEEEKALSLLVEQARRWREDRRAAGREPFPRQYRQFAIDSSTPQVAAEGMSFPGTAVRNTVPPLQGRQSAASAYAQHSTGRRRAAAW